MTTEPGVYPGLTFAQYAAIDALNAHTLIPFVESAKRGAHKTEQDDRPGPDQRLGEAVHRRILEPELFKATAEVVSEVVVGKYQNGKDKTKKLCDADGLELADKQHPGKLVITPEMDALTRDMRNAVVAQLEASAEVLGGDASETVKAQHRAFRNAVLARGRNELSIVWDDPDFGVRCKARLDRMVDPDWIVDIKTTRNIVPELFDRDAEKFGYAVQAVWYKRGALMCGLCEGVPNYVTLAIENTAPHDLWIGTYDEGWSAEAWAEACRAVARWKHWRATGDAPGVIRNLCRTMIRPAWAAGGDASAPYALQGGKA